MSDAHHWFLFGEIAAWVDEELFALGESRINVENLTRLAAGPQGQIGMMRMADHATINLDALPYWVKAPREMVEGLSKTWGMTSIVLPTNSERKKFTLND